MKSVFLDAANVPVNEMTKKKKTRKQQLKDRPLNARERRSLKVYDVPRDIRYEWFVPLHELWQGYMKDLYGQGCDSQQFAQKLLKADFHGAIFTVVRSTNPTYVGATGIVVQETLNLFKIATKNNKLKQIPKAGSVFTVTADACQCVFTLYGQQLLCRAAERAAKKFKAKPTIDL
ncbi:RNase P/RNase MRP complex subunit [Apophysomyces sp. BC1015]|nr:RNase P/RNase MRP complex subunit [Apophysomyces sp. BC1015]KAG0174393.1 RNase P/RNase MRP complex subunit [Apophysomyces sp. BC1021]